MQNSSVQDSEDALPESLVPSGLDRGSIQSIERAAQVLALFDHDVQQLTPGLVAERLGFNRTTAHRYLHSLQASGFLDSDNGLGPLFDQLSAFLSGRQQVLGLAPGIMRTLADQSGLSVVLSFLGRSGAVVTLIEEASDGAIILTVRVGAVLELRAAQSRVLLAFQADPGVVQRLQNGMTAAEAREENAVLARVRRDRLAWADLGHEGLASVAVPIFGRRDIQAAMGLLGTTATLTPNDSANHRVELLREAADGLSAILAN